MKSTKRRRIYAALIALTLGLVSAWSDDCPDCHIINKPAASPIKIVENISDVIANVSVETDEGCPVSDPTKTVRNIVFVFEGHLGYTDAIGAAFRKIQKLKPVCSTHLDENSARDLVEFSTGTAIDFAKLRDQTHGYVSLGSPNALKYFVLRGMCMSGALNFSDTEVLYLPEYADLNLATKCAEKLAKHAYQDASGRTLYPTLSVLGYSYGGFAALSFGKLLTESGLKVDLGLTIDPVPKGAPRVVTNALQFQMHQLAERIELKKPTNNAGTNGNQIDPRAPTDFKAPEGVRWVNYWQEIDNRIDHGSRGKNLGLHGQGVNNATVNKLVFPEVDPKNGSNGGHWRIFEEFHVMNAIHDELSKLPTSGAVKTSWGR